MATIYRFIIEEKRKGVGGRKDGETMGSPTSKKTTGKGKWVSIFGGSKGGVEHNRKLRAINPLLNKATGGMWEKSMRLGRAAGGLVKKNTVTGRYAISGTALAIIIALVIQTTLKIQNAQRTIANKENTQNYKSLENGFTSVHGEYKVARDYWSGRINFNENK